MFVIEDGAGHGYKAEVTENKELLVYANSRDEVVDASERGNAFMISTGEIALTTTASFSGVLYIKNTSDFNMHFHTMTAAYSGAGANVIKSYINPTAGTLISGASAANNSCANFGLVRIFDGLTYKGADAATITDGTVFGESLFTTSFQSPTIGAFTLAPGSSIGIAVKPAAAGSLYINALVFFKEVEV